MKFKNNLKKEKPSRVITDLRHLVKATAEEFGDRDLYIYKEGKEFVGYSFNRLWDEMNCVGSAFSKLSIMGKAVAVIGDMRPQYFTTYLATINGNGCIVPIDKDLSVETIADFLEISKAEAFVYSGNINKIAPQVAELAKGIKYFIPMQPDEDYKFAENVITFEELVAMGREAIAAGDTSYQDIEIDMKNVCAMLFTSGTTGTSKCVMLCEKNIWSTVNSACATVEFFKTDVEDAFTTAGNSIPAKYVFASKPADATIENEDVKTMAPGTSSVSYTINIPSATEWKKGTSTNYAFKVHSAKLNGKEISVENSTVAVVKNNNKSVFKDIPDANYQNTALPADVFMKTLESDGLTPYSREDHLTFKWAPDSFCNDGGAASLEAPFDGTGKFYHSNYSNRGYGVQGIPIRAIVDLQSKRGVNGFEVWRRHNNKVPRIMEFYALDDCEYVHSATNGSISYNDSDLTYLGTLNMDQDVSEASSTTVDYIETRYLLVKFTKSTNNVVHCSEFVVWK